MNNPQHKGNKEVWLWASAVAAIVTLLILTINNNLDLPVVQLNPDGNCVAVIYPDSDGRVSYGQCGMLPEIYTVEHVGYKL